MAVKSALLVAAVLLALCSCNERAGDAPPPARSAQLPHAPPGATGARAAGLSAADPEPDPALPMPGEEPDPEDEAPPLAPPDGDGGGGVEL